MVVGSLDGWSPMVAMKAVYFKGLWEDPFEAEPFEMIVNRPFVFAICDDSTGVVVFLGAVADPLADGPAQGGWKRIGWAAWKDAFLWDFWTFRVFAQKGTARGKNS